MRQILVIIFSIFLSYNCFGIENSNQTSEDVIVIDLNKIDQSLLQNLDKNKKNEDILTNEDKEIIENNDEESEIIEQESINILDENITSTYEVLELSNMWDKIESEDLIFLLENIENINSLILKQELLSILDVNNQSSSDIQKDDFEYLIIKSLLKLGDRKKSYEIIQSFQNINEKYDLFYKTFELNYLLSIYQISEACDFRNEIKNLNFTSESNFFLKVDIFCLVLNEKFDEANLLISLLDETNGINDKYFQYLYDNLQDNSSNKDIDNNILINEDNIFLYSAMHRMGNIPLTEKFLMIDPINLSMPIILSNSNDIELRIKAAHLAYFNNILNIDSLAALYQVFDFSFDELNDQSIMLNNFDNKIEKGMAYFYQLINIQLMPNDRLNAILKFWDFASQYDLELIAYELSLKSLNSIEPSSELSFFGPEVIKAYVYSGDFQMAEKWLIFAENSANKDEMFQELNSSKILFNLFNIKESENLTDVLYNSLKEGGNELLIANNQNETVKNTVLYTIFSLLSYQEENPFKLNKSIGENRSMPSTYIIEKIRNSIINQNQTELILAIIVSINENSWDQIHPEHLRLVLMGLKDYKNGYLLNDILIEVLNQSNII